VNHRPLSVDFYAVASRNTSAGRQVVPGTALLPCSFLLPSAKETICAEWGESDNGRQAKFYTLSAKGKKQLSKEEFNWNRLAGAVTRILQTAQ
jgi:hypothetical protein